MADWSKRLFSIVLSFLGLQSIVWGTSHYQMALYWGRLHGQLDKCEWVTASFKYTLPMLIVGAVMLWGATKLWSRWRLGMGVLALCLGIGLIVEASGVMQRNDELLYETTLGSVLICAALIDVGIGAGLLVGDRNRQKSLKAAAKGA